MQALVFIPTYNERGNIEALINQILNLNFDIGVLVVDDYSSDGTGEILDKIKKSQPRLSVIHRLGKRGRGLAGIVGFKYAIKQNVDYIIEMDGDFSHDPKYIPLFLKEIKDCDVVIGSRRVKSGQNVCGSSWRKFLSRCAQYFSRSILGIDILDATSGFRCYKRYVLENIELDKIISVGPSIIEEINLCLVKKGCKIKEVPIVFGPRSGGTSKLTSMKILRTFFTLLRVRFKR